MKEMYMRLSATGSVMGTKEDVGAIRMRKAIQP